MYDIKNQITIFGFLYFKAFSFELLIMIYDRRRAVLTRPYGRRQSMYNVYAC